jgi:1,6-anhydro-N-acetylmuramate kinase
MKQLKMRTTRAEDATEVGEWLCGTPNNLFDPAILEYPTLRSVSSYDEDGNVAHLPSQQVLMLESLAVKPGISPMATGQAFRDLVKGQELLASSFGIREIYFVCKDEDVVRVAESHGFERIAFPVVRMKLK